jgi:hypothetical protein
MNTSTLTLTADQVGRTLVRKWDRLAVIGLMVSCGTYGVYAIAQRAGF